MTTTPDLDAAVAADPLDRVARQARLDYCQEYGLDGFDDALALAAFACRREPGVEMALAYAKVLDEYAGTVKCGKCIENSGKANSKQCLSGGPFSGWKFEYPEDGKCTFCKGTGRIPDCRAAQAELIRVSCELFETNLSLERVRDFSPAQHALDMKSADLSIRSRKLLPIVRESLFAGLGPGALVGNDSVTVYHADGTPRGIRYLETVISDDWLSPYGTLDCIECPAELWLRPGGLADYCRDRHPLTRGVRLTTMPRLYTFDRGLCIFHLGPERKKHQFGVAAKYLSDRGVLERLLAAEFPWVRIELPGDEVQR